MTGNSRFSALQPEPHETLTFKSCHLKKQSESIDIKTGPYDVSLSKVLAPAKSVEEDSQHHTQRIQFPVNRTWNTREAKASVTTEIQVQPCVLK